MKLRIMGNSLRLRISRSETARPPEARSPRRNEPFCATGECEAHLRVRAVYVDQRPEYTGHTKQR